MSEVDEFDELFNEYEAYAAPVRNPLLGDIFKKRTHDLLAYIRMKKGSSKMYFSQCNDDANVFTFDCTSATATNPSEIKKDMNMSFHFKFNVKSIINLKKIHMHVSLNGSVIKD